MLRLFCVKNFRCFSDIVIKDLERVNLFAGKNNVGKTALLEALWLHHGYFNPELPIRVDRWRGIESILKEEFMWDLFNEFDPTKEIELLGETPDRRQRTLRIRTQQRRTSRLSLGNGKQDKGNGESSLGGFAEESTEVSEAEALLEYSQGQDQEIASKVVARATIKGNEVQFDRPPGVKEPTGIFLSARRPEQQSVHAERFANLAVSKMENALVPILQIIEPRLQKLLVLHRGGTPMVYGDLGGPRLVPLPLMGDGMMNVLGIALAIAEARDGTVLIDEIENGLHYSTLGDIWQALAELARGFGTQIFATTHSRECILAAHKALVRDGHNDFRLYRLERGKDKIEVVGFDRDTLEAAIEMDLEVR